MAWVRTSESHAAQVPFCTLERLVKTLQELAVFWGRDGHVTSRKFLSTTSFHPHPAESV